MKRFLKYFVMVFILLIPFVVRAEEFTNINLSDDGILTFNYDNDDVSYISVQYRDITSYFNKKSDYIRIEDGEGSLDLTDYEVSVSCQVEEQCHERNAFIVVLSVVHDEEIIAMSELGIGFDDDGYYLLDTVDITFELDGGTMPNAPEVLTVYKGVKIHLASYLNYNTNVTKKGYYFDGFYLNPDDDKPINMYSLNIFNEDTTLYALWTDENKEVTIKFESNGGTKIEDKKAKIYTKIDLPKDPVKDGYVFVGWYYDKELEMMVYSEGFSSDRDRTIYAKWAKKENVVDTIRLYVKRPLIGDKVEPIEKNTEYGSLVEQSLKPGAYVFDERLNVTFSGYLVEVDYEERKIEDTFYGTFEKDKEYIASVSIELKDEYLGKNIDIVYNPKVIVNDEDVKDFYCDGYYDVEENYRQVCNVTYRIKATDNKYGIMDGKDQVINGKNPLVVRADGDIKKFKELKVDNNVVDPKNYELSEGSTIVSLKPSYLDSLNNGVHKLTFVYEDGEVDTTFSLNSTKVKNPLTVDNIILVFILIFISSIIIVSIKNKRKLRYEI